MNHVCFEIPVTISTADLAVGVPGEAFGSRARAGAVNVLYGCFDCLQGGGLTSANDQFWTQSGTGAGGTEANDTFGAALY